MMNERNDELTAIRTVSGDIVEAGDRIIWARRNGCPQPGTLRRVLPGALVDVEIRPNTYDVAFANRPGKVIRIRVSRVVSRANVVKVR